MVETPLRRSRRILSQSDDEQSVASSVASATRSTNNDVIADTPNRRTRSASNASAASTATPTRRTRSSSNVSNASNTTPKRRTREARSKGGKEAGVSELDVIPESIETDGDATATSKGKGDDSTGSKKKRSREASADSSSEANQDAPLDSAKGDDGSSPPMESSEKKKRKKKSKPESPGGKSSERHRPKEERETPKKMDENKVKAVPQKKQQSSKHELAPFSKKSPPMVTPSTSPKLTMDVNVHRLRFLKLNPKSILAMSSTPTGAPGDSSHSPQRLAVSREGGSVELLSPQDRWVSVGTVPGVRGRDVDALTWVCGKYGKESVIGGNMMSLDYDDQSHLTRNEDEQRRLFGCSRDGTIFELDFAKKRHKSVIGSGGGGVFCLASLCSSGKCCCSGRSCGGYFAAGCEDGSVRIYRTSIDDGGSFPELVSTLPSAGNAILSIAWVAGQSSTDGGMGGSVLFAGVADGTIRRYDCNTSRVLGTISTGSVLASSKDSTSISYRWNSTLRMTVENLGLQEATKVWALAALSDGTVVSGDSLGHVQIWDGASGTMTQTFDHNESGADVLCLAVSDDENKIFAGGIDPRVQCIQRQCLPANSSNQESNPVRKWINAQANRKHTHDVKALAICHKATRQGSNELLVSGSVDTRICIYSAEDFRSSRPKIWYNWPSVSPVSISRKQRLLAVTRDDRVDLYRLDSSSSADSVTILRPEARDETKCFVKSLQIKSSFNLVCSVISDDGAFLAASDPSSLYLFSLEVDDDNGIIDDVRPSKVNLAGKCKQPCTALRFDSFGRLICATVDGPINALRVSPNEVSLDHVFKEHISGLSASSHHFPVSSLDVSVDGKWLAAGRFASGKGAVHVFTLPTKKCGHYQHWWSVPEMEVPTTSIKFLGRGGTESSLCVGYSNNTFNIFNLESRSLSQWNTDMGSPLVKLLPRELTSRSEPVTRIVCNPTSPQKLILVCE
jgi:U3 small nucleolar RNA-associated protein 4